MITIRSEQWLCWNDCQQGVMDAMTEAYDWTGGLITVSVPPAIFADVRVLSERMNELHDHLRAHVGEHSYAAWRTEQTNCVVVFSVWREEVVK